MSEWEVSGHEMSDHHVTGNNVSTAVCGGKVRTRAQVSADNLVATVHLRICTTAYANTHCDAIRSARQEH